jgi:hypothetical protein
MKGYLMQDREWIVGEDLFLESFSPENTFGVVFEDDGDAAYFYGVEKDKAGTGVQILDALHIYERDEEDEVAGKRRLQIVWSRDWLKCALVIDGQCHALYDFEAHGGYNINEFPPPNDVWTQGDRQLTDEIVKRLF